MNQSNILVTSIGGDLGQAVCKALRYSKYDIKIIGSDCKSFIPYSIFCDDFHIIPKAEDLTYTKFINEFVLYNSIELVYICSEQELLYICDHFDDISLELRSRFVLLPFYIIDICRDKYKTVQFLRSNHFPYPYSVLIDDSKPIDNLLKDFTYPFVVKKITDSGSKHLHIVENLQDFNKINNLNNDYMLQEYIPGIEYTSAVYRDPYSKEIYVIILERILKAGMSAEVKVVFNKEIENLCREVAIKLNLIGSINIQLRKQEDSPPVIFEINPRYSSTAFMRAVFGFNDVIFAFENIIYKKAITAPNIKPGEAYRYFTEYFIF